MKLPDGIIRTSMGVYVLAEDVCLSRWVENALALDIPQNLREIVSFAQYIPAGGVVIDAGACIGDHAITYSQLVGEYGHVFAIEPHPVTYQALRLNMARLINVSTFECALSDTVGRASLQCDPNIGASFLTENAPTSVNCCRLDDFLQRFDRCDFIHLDAEGYEPRILRGGRRLMQRFRPVMVIEICDKHLRRAGFSETELMALLDELGYDVHAIPEHIEPELRDVLCLPRVA